MTNTEDVLEITVTGGQQEQVDSFVYLGSSIKNNTDCVGEVKSRLAMGMAVILFMYLFIYKPHSEKGK